MAYIGMASTAFPAGLACKVYSYGLYRYALYIYPDNETCRALACIVFPDVYHEGTSAQIRWVDVPPDKCPARHARRNET